jgi:hypothetical protein
MTSANTLPDDIEALKALLRERDAQLERMQDVVDSQKAAIATDKGKRSICTVCSWRQEGCNLIPIRFDGNQIDEANGTRTAAGIEELHPGVSGNGGR